MRFFLFCLLLSSPALAQVTTDDHALDALKPAASAPAKPAAPAVATHRAVRRVAPAARHVAARPVAPPQVPLAPPANPVIAPAPFVMPVHPRPKPPPVPVKADAVGVAAPIAGGTRITFGPGVASLNQATYDAIAAIAAQAIANPALQVSVTAWAPGTPDDPSPPRTLALERALAARAVMINAGLVSDRVLAVSKGFDGIGAGPPDRADMTVSAPKQTPAGSPLPPPVAAHGTTKPAPAVRK